MQISTKGRYALRLMLDLAVHNTGELVKIKDISARENISEKYLEQIISSLKKADYHCFLLLYSIPSHMVKIYSTFLYEYTKNHRTIPSPVILSLSYTVLFLQFFC